MEISLQTPIKKKIIHKHVCTHITDGVVCKRTFRYPSEMQVHIRFHHLKIFDNVCEKCNKIFEQKGSLETHEKTEHLNERRFKCEKCGDAFNSKDTLKKHMIHLHTTEKPYKCEHVDINNKQCELKCKTPQILRAHMQTHLEKKRYQCGKCENSYGRLDSLQHHIDTIHDLIIVPYECPDCPNEYKTFAGLWTHYLFIHADRSCPRVMAAIEKTRMRENVRNKKRRATDPVFKIHCGLSSSFANWMRRHGRSKNCRTPEVTGLSYEAIITYLNDNTEGLKYGDAGVDVDHIRPKSSFKKAGPIEQRELWWYLNLRLMDAYQNRHVKRGHYDPVAYAESIEGKKIAELRPGWVLEFGETPGPDMEACDEDMDLLPDTANDDGYLSDESEYTGDEDSDCSDPEASDEDAGGDVE
jgi:hypothetical protein